VSSPIKAIHRLRQGSSIRDTVEEILAAAIISGEIAPDSLVSVPTLAARFGVSSTPVREAMLNLKKRGFVEPIRNTGFRVTTLSDRELRQIVQLRQLLEGSAMRLITSQQVTVKKAFYQEHVAEISSAAERSDFASFSKADAAFHLDLLKEIDNERLVRLVRDLRGQTRMVGLAAMGLRAEMEKSANEDRELLDLLADGRSLEAQDHMVLHISHVVEWSHGGGQRGQQP
jgi:DNA-binding GntR family transcriptional regulator